MNLFKRAWWRLTGHLGKTLMLIGLFFVICALVLSGFLIRSAAARAADDAKQRVGAVATMRLDVNALINSGKARQSNGAGPSMLGEAADLHRSLVDRICASPVVARCNYTTDATAFPTTSTKLYQPVSPPAGSTAVVDLFKADGVRDLNEVSEFRAGDSQLVSGRGITPDSRSDEIVVEERLAEENGLEVGDTVELRVGEIPPPGQKPNEKEYVFEVVGIYRSGIADTGSYVPAMTDPANHLYLTPDGASLLLGRTGGAGRGVVNQATFTLEDPAGLGRLRQDARAAGADLEIFPLSVNDKQYQALVGPITRTADFATVTVWLVAVAGTVILALIVASSLRERRKELGILLALGEKKPKLLGQHLAEVMLCAVIATGLAGACSQLLSQVIGDRLLAGEVSSAKDEAAARGPERDPSDPLGGMKPEEDVDPIDTLAIRLGPADICKVGATGLGIATLATLLPGARVLRLNPRDLLTKGD
ncbi:ABC transporter permease [Streptomyces sp. B93]|uniref:ABC transporter permease n=1 Tax=Streptomyces sp. B93 TaxID=2824875 RepID=UPI001B35B65F|nr:FtsX-like permease family protein [Streptomyces sp. B93]MBQ1092806.1 FtsX-like permease family protein [Streptomyces sp. B93]